MGAGTFDFIYLVCFFLGLGFAVLCALLSGVFSGPSMDVGDVHVNMGGIHTDGSSHIGPADGSVHFQPLSPVSIALFITAFGGIGYLLKKMGQPAYVHVPAAGFTGIVVGGFAAYVLYKVTKMTAGSSHARFNEEIGGDGEVTIAIPNGGVGEVAYVVRGSRFNNPAKTVDGKELPVGVKVKLVRKEEHLYLVEKA